MHKIARQYPATGVRSQKWHIDLWAANKWVLEQCGVIRISISGIDTYTTPEYYSARRETIGTGRNFNGIMLLPG